MTTVRKMLLVAGLAGAMAPAALAQYVFSTQLPSPGDSGTISTTYQNFNLGTAPAGTYTSYLVVTNWFDTAVSDYGFSSEASFALTANSVTGVYTTGTPTGAGTVYRNVGAGTATGSTANTQPHTNMYWTGNLTTNWTSTGANNINLAIAQRFGTTATQYNSRWQDVRVILNPNNTFQSDMALPTSFTELGTFTDTHGRTTNAITQATTTQLNWFHFQLTSAVNAGTGPGTSLLDIDTQGSNGGILDTEMRLYRVDPATGRLVPAGSGAFSVGEDAHADDDGGGIASTPGATNSYLSQFTYGDTNTSAWVNGAQRRYGYAAPTAGPENYDGRDGSLVAGDYYLLVADYNITETATVITPTQLNGTQTGLTGQTSWAVTGGGSGGGGTGTIMLNIAYVPTPGSAALLGAGILASARRRRV